MNTDAALPGSEQGGTAIAQRVEDVISRAGLRDVSSLAAMIDRVAQLRGKAISLEQIGDNKWGTLTGFWVETPEMSRIFVRRTDPAGYQVVCALHELMHILLDHPGCLTDPTRQGTSVPSAPRRARNVDTATSQQAHDIHEAEAELGAQILARSLLHGIDDSTERRFG